MARNGRHEFQRAHVVQAVGELDQEHADVVGNRQEQLAKVLGLFGLPRHQLQPLQLCQSFDQRADLRPEDVVDFASGGLGILYGVMQQRCDDGGVVELEVGQDRRDLERMRKKGIAGGAGLGAMRFHGIDVGAVQQVFIGVGVIGPDPFYQIVLPHHPRSWRLGRPQRHPGGRRHRNRFGRGLHLGCAAAPTHHWDHCLHGPGPNRPALLLPSARTSAAAPFWAAKMLDLGHARVSNAEPAVPINRKQPWPAHGNHENVNKSKGPDRGPGLA